MDPRLLRYYEDELRHLRDVGAEFAKQNPAVAAGLGMEGVACSDPYVERLLEGFSFLAARIRLKLDAEFPRFTQHLLEMVYPHYLAPTPSMAVVRFEPDLTEGALTQGFVIERGTPLRTSLLKGTRTACEYRTASDVTLWPIQLDKAEYLTHAIDAPGMSKTKAALRIRLRTAPGLKFSALKLDRLRLYLHGADVLPFRIYEELMAHTIGVVAQPATPKPAWQEVQDERAVRGLGFGDDEALMPLPPRSFRGYRLLHEYFAFPKRFAFVEIGGLGRAVSRCSEEQLEILVPFDRTDSRLENALDVSNLALHCVPVINLFEHEADRIHVSEVDTDFHVVPDRTRPMDLEVYRITGVTGHGTAADEEQEFLPFYASRDVDRYAERKAFYVAHRAPRLLSAKQRRDGVRSGYVGHEVYLSLVDGNAAPYRPSLRQLEVHALCTNRDLPMMLALGDGDSDFSLKSGAPVQSIRCLAGPTRPTPSAAGGELAWRLVNHLSLNYLSLSETDEKRGAEALRNLLGLYAKLIGPEVKHQIEGVRSVNTTPVTRRLPIEGPLAFGRGLEVEVTMDESGFEGIGVFLLGAVLDAFFQKYVSINSFTETVIREVNRGEVMRWPPRLGQRPTL